MIFRFINNCYRIFHTSQIALSAVPFSDLTHRLSGAFYHSGVVMDIISVAKKRYSTKAFDASKN